MAADVIRELAGALSGPAPPRLKIEADLDEHDFQLVIENAGDGAGQASYPALRSRLVEIGRRCDGFDVERMGAAGIEVWCCFSLRRPVAKR